MEPVHIDTTKISTTSSLGLAFFKVTQQITCGKAYRAANLLASMTAYELNGSSYSSSGYRCLVLLALADLAKHAPSATLILPNWTATLHRISINSGETAGRDVEALMKWAQMRWPTMIVLK